MTFDGSTVEIPHKSDDAFLELEHQWRRREGALARRAIRLSDWLFMRMLLERLSAQSYLEFGSGLSTLLVARFGVPRVLSLETDRAYLDHITPLMPASVELRQWNNREASIDEHFDLALVDGDLPRIEQARLACEHATYVLIHDPRGCGRGALAYTKERLDELPATERIHLFKQPLERSLAVSLQEQRWIYEIEVIDEPGNDQRRWPSDTIVRQCINALPKAVANYVGTLLERQPIRAELNAEEIVAFHHTRREYGCCPRIKWSEIGAQSCGC